MSDVPAGEPPRMRRAAKVQQLARTRAQVVEATAQLLQEVGFRDLTIELVTQRSGVARSTIYRHWNNLAELAVEGFDAALGPNPPMADLGDVRSDLIAYYRRLAKVMLRPIWRDVLPALLEIALKDPRFDPLIGRLVEARRQQERVIFTRAVQRGEISPTAPVEWALDAVTGALYHRLLLTRADLTEPGLIEWLVDAVLGQILLSRKRPD